MKQLACSVCEEKYQVSSGVNKVTCAECYITGEVPRVEDGVNYRSREAFLKLVGAGFDDWKVIKDKTGQEKKLIKRFNRMRKREDSLIKIQRKLGISWPKTKKLEGYRLLDLGYKRKDIAEEFGVNVATVSRWKVLQKESEEAQMSCPKKKMQHSNSESSSGGLSSEAKNQENHKYWKSKIRYNFSQKTLNFVRRESENECEEERVFRTQTAKNRIIC